MCCLFTTIIFLGPRFGILIWWLIQPVRFAATFNTFIWPLLGLIFLPWSTLMYVALFPSGGIIGFDWIWLGLALIADIASYSGSAYGNRDRIPGVS